MKAAAAAVHAARAAQEARRRAEDIEMILKQVTRIARHPRHCGTHKAACVPWCHFESCRTHTHAPARFLSLALASSRALYESTAAPLDPFCPLTTSVTFARARATSCCPR
eukprot:6180669-Pleurochrysis_carterae.AAC.5